MKMEKFARAKRNERFFTDSTHKCIVFLFLVNTYEIFKEQTYWSFKAQNVNKHGCQRKVETQKKCMKLRLDLRLTSVYTLIPLTDNSMLRLQKLHQESFVAKCVIF